jgi:hypothetical protein
MSEADRAAMARGTLTSGIDLAQVAEARRKLAEMREAMPEPLVVEPCANQWRMSTFVLTGLLIGSIVWLVLG